MADEKNASRVLLVDDDETVRRAYAKVLQRLGFVVVTATDGAEAVGLLSSGAFEVIVSDLVMPKMGGIEFLATVRKHDLDIPVVLITGTPDLATAVEAVEYGAFRYLTKPVDVDTFGEVVRRAASMHRMAVLKREALALAGSEGRQLGDRASLDDRFNSALAQLWMAYQPIVNWTDRSVFAYEALVRSNEPTLRSPLDLLDAAERLGRLGELGHTIRKQVAHAVPDAPKDALLFVNLHAADLNDTELFASTSPLASIAPRVVLEITERASLHGVNSLATKVVQLRDLGFRIAVDDLGAGYAGLSSFSQLEPDFVKLDMSLVRGVDVSSKKRSLVRAMIRLCVEELSIQVVSEGVETTQERDALAQDGGNLLQGYLFAKPGREFTAPMW